MLPTLSLVGFINSCLQNIHSSSSKCSKNLEISLNDMNISLQQVLFVMVDICELFLLFASSTEEAHAVKLQVLSSTKTTKDQHLQAPGISPIN